MSLLSFSDESERSDNDSAVAKAIAALSGIDDDKSISSQEKETRSMGGIVPR